MAINEAGLFTAKLLADTAEGGIGNAEIRRDGFKRRVLHDLGVLLDKVGVALFCRFGDHAEHTGFKGGKAFYQGSPAKLAELGQGMEQGVHFFGGGEPALAIGKGLDILFRWRAVKIGGYLEYHLVIRVESGGDLVAFHIISVAT